MFTAIRSRSWHVKIFSNLIKLYYQYDQEHSSEASFETKIRKINRMVIGNMSINVTFLAH